jgi:hypothetical protein
MKRKLSILLLMLSAGALMSQSLTQANFTSQLTPQYMASGTSTRLPVVFRAQVQSLQPNTTYRYFVQAGIYTDIGGTNSGAGNPMLISQNGSTYTYTTGPSLSSAGSYETFTTDGTGKYTGWFGFVNTGNARFTAGNYIIPTITIDSINTGTTKFRFALGDSIKVLQFAASAGATNGTGIYGISNGIAKNIVVLYDNTGGTGRPLAMTYLEDEGTTVASTVTYYTDSVNAKNGRWGTIVPNTNTNGVRRIEQYSAATGTSMNFNTDDDGIWPSSANTVNPLGGSTTPIRITITDAPLRLEQISTTVPQMYSLSQNYPNPFNPTTNIRFSIPKGSNVSLRVYDMLGKEVMNISWGKLGAGTYLYEINTTQLASGTYFYKLETEGFTETKKMTLIK